MRFARRAFLLLLLAIPSTVFADSLTITTDPVSAAPGAVTEKITAQTQDSSGAELKVPETTTLTLRSSSPTGEFSSNGTNWVSVTTLTMSRNTANRSFYYKDSSAGTHTIYVSATGYGETSQSIYIGTGAPDPDSDDSDDDSDEGDSSGSTSQSSSTHSSGDELKTGSEISTLYVYAGRDRTTLVGVPVQFEARASATKTGTAIKGARFNWTYGDGMHEMGSRPTHIYNSPGQYVVVVRAWAGEKEAYTRVLVTVREIEIRLTEIVPGTNGKVTVSNGPSEVNLGGIKVYSGDREFTFPRDTILLPKGSVTLSAALLGFAPDMRTKIKFPGGQQITRDEKAPVYEEEPERPFVGSAFPGIPEKAPTPMEAVRIEDLRTVVPEEVSRVPAGPAAELGLKGTSTKKVTVITKKKSLWKRAWGNVTSVFSRD